LEARGACIIKISKQEHEMGGACCAHGEVKNAYKLLVGKLEGKRPPKKT
jgi:hypothetical protein